MGNLFETLGLTPRFDLDLQELHRRYLELSGANHPDRFLDPLDQADAADRSARINEAYRVLGNPHSRAEALLLLLGGPSPESDKSLPVDLLGTMMERREELEAATARGDQATLAKLHRWAAGEQAAHLRRIGELFAQAAPGTPPATVPRAIRTELNALRYFQRMVEQTREAER